MEKNNKETLAVIGCLSLVVLLPVVIVANILLGGYVVEQLWGWFVCPLGMPHITYLHAAGLSALVAYMCPIVDTSNLAKKEGYGISDMISSIIAVVLLRPALTLLVGYLIHTYSH